MGRVQPAPEINYSQRTPTYKRKQSFIKTKQKKRTSAFFVCYPFLKEPKTARTKPPKNLGSLMV